MREGNSAWVKGVESITECIIYCSYYYIFFIRKFHWSLHKEDKSLMQRLFLSINVLGKFGRNVFQIKEDMSLLATVTYFMLKAFDINFQLFFKPICICFNSVCSKPVSNIQAISIRFLQYIYFVWYLPIIMTGDKFKNAFNMWITLA